MRYHVMDKSYGKYPFPYGLVETKDTREEADQVVGDKNAYYGEQRFYVCEEA